MASGPPRLPELVPGQQIREGPYTITVTQSMALNRERENRELSRRWHEEQRRNQQRGAGDATDEYWGEFKEFNIRRRFIRRVFSILTLQLMFTSMVIALFTIVEEAKIFMLTNPVLYILALCGFFFSYLSISCCVYARREFPCNVIHLIVLTLSLSILASYASVYKNLDEVLIAVGATALVCLVIFITAAVTKFDLTKYAGLMIIFIWLGLISMIIMIIVYIYTQRNLIRIAVALIGAFIMSTFLFFDIQTVMGGRSIELSPDEVVYATTQLYVDIILLYQYILGVSD